MNCKIQMINLTVGLSVSRGNGKRMISMLKSPKSDCMQQCRPVRPQQNWHPFVIKTLQIIYLIKKESLKLQHLLIAPMYEVFSYFFFQLVKKYKKLLKFTSHAFFPLSLCVQVVCVVCGINA